MFNSSFLKEAECSTRRNESSTKAIQEAHTPKRLRRTGLFSPLRSGFPLAGSHRSILLFYPFDGFISVVFHDSLLFEVFYLNKDWNGSASCTTLTTSSGSVIHTQVFEQADSNSAISFPHFRRASLSFLIASRISCLSKHVKNRSRP